jgi:hypothetical protein
MPKPFPFNNFFVFHDSTFTPQQKKIPLWLNLYLSPNFCIYWTNLYLLAKPFNFMAKPLPFSKFVYFLVKPLPFGKTFILHG